MSEIKNTIPKLLPDEPTITDSFGGHDRVASSICDVILNEAAPKSIALSGNWGSGKSSVIKMLIDKLKDTCLIFEFDAWEHEGDPLRISFLEKFTDYFSLQNPQLIDNKLAKELINELNGKKQDIEEINTPILSFKNIFALLSIFFITFMLSKFSLQVNPANNKIDYFPLYCIIANLIIFLFIYIASIQKRYTNYEYGKNNDGDDDVEVKSGKLHIYCKIMRDELFNYFKYIFKKDGYDNRKVIYKSKEATSIEFQEKFVHFLKEIKSKLQDDRKLVIIIDNLDRVEREDALKVWSTMRTFFVHENSSDFIKPWLIVPYDFKGVQKLWNEKTPYEESNSTVNDGKNIDTGANEKRKYVFSINNDTLADSFTDKSFQIKFEVPPPIISNWNDEFTTLLSSTFNSYLDNDDENNEYTKIIALYRIMNKTYDNPPTPRQIKLFINDLIPLFIQNRENNMPLHLIAFYNLSRKATNHDDKLFIKFLLNNDALVEFSKIKGYLNENFQKQLAALLFNTTPDNALQILVNDRLKKTIEDCKYNNFDELKKTDYRYLLDDVIRELIILIGNQVNLLFNIIKSLEYIKTNIYPDKNYIPTWNLIAKSIPTNLLISKLNKDDASILNILNANIEKSMLVDVFSNLLLSVLNIANVNNANLNFNMGTSPQELILSGQNVSQDFIEYLNFLYLFIDFLEEEKRTKILADNIKPIYDVNTFSTIADLTIKEENNLEIFKKHLIYFIPNKSKQEFTDHWVLNYIQTNDVVNTNYEVFKIFLEYDLIDIPSVLNFLKIAITLPNNEYISTSLLKFVFILINNTNEEYLASLNEGNYLLNNMKEIDISSLPNEYACHYLLFLFVDIKLVTNYKTILPNILKELTKIISEYGVLKNIFQLLIENDIVDPILSEINNNNPELLISSFEPKDIFDDFVFFDDALGDKFDNFLKNYEEAKGLCKELDLIEGSEYINNILINLLEIKGSESKKIEDYSIDYLNKLKRQDWIDAISNSNSETALDIVLRLNNKNIDLNLDIALSDAILDFIDKYKVNNSPASKFEQNFETFVNSLSKSIKIVHLINIIKDRLCKNRNVHQILKFYNLLLLKNINDLDLQVNDFNEMTRLLFKKFIEDHDNTGLVFILNMLNYIDNFNPEKSILDDFKSRIIEAYKIIEDEDAKSNLVKIMELLDIPIPELRENNNEEESDSNISKE